MDDDNTTTGADLEDNMKDYYKNGLKLALAQDKSENNYLILKKKYEKEKNEEGNLNLDELVTTFNIYKDYTNAYINYIKNNEKVYTLNQSLPNKLESDLKREDEYILQQQKEQGGGKRKTKGKSNKVAKKAVVSQKKQSIYKEILGKQMKIYKIPDSRKEYVKYKGELHHISDYKDLMKQKAIAKTKTKTKATQQKAIAKTKSKPKK